MRALVLAFALLAVLPAAAQEITPTLSLTGTGSVMVTPDTATISVGVETEDQTAGPALAANTERAGAVIAALKAAGVEARDIQTSNFSVQPVYSDRKSLSSGAPRIAGYRVTNQVMARVRVLDDLGAILDKVVSTGANRINNISFSVAEDGDARDKARARAVEDATRKAQIYAEAAGVSLGPILSISETEQGGGPRPMMMEARAMAAPVPIEAGTAAITARVNITWQITAP